MVAALLGRQLKCSKLPGGQEGKKKHKEKEKRERNMKEREGSEGKESRRRKEKMENWARRRKYVRKKKLLSFLPGRRKFV